MHVGVVMILIYVAFLLGLLLGAALSNNQDPPVCL